MIYHKYISLCLFFVLVFYLFLEIESFTPTGRLAHSSVLVENKIYFFGGVAKGFSTNEVFYLDISQPFSIATPPWNDLTAVNEGMPIRSSFGTASLSDTNNEQNIYLIGGITRDIITNNVSLTSLIYKFSLKSGQWEIPIINKGKAPERRREINAVNDNSGKIYIFGGSAGGAVGSSTLIHFNDLVIFNVVELSWTINYQLNAPTPRASYSATLLSNGVIVYIGGFGPFNNVLKYVDISEINLFDTNSLTWSVKIANLKGQIENRRRHTAVLAPDGNIIIYGGSKKDFFQVIPNLAVLNTTTETFEWTTPLVSNLDQVPSLTSHTANLVGNYMIVAFGNITQPNAYPASINANIYLMDIRNYTWINTFDLSTETSNPPTLPTPTHPLPNPPTSTTPPTQNKLDVIIGTVVGIIGTAALMVIGFFGYKWYQGRRPNDILEIHGNNSK